MAPWAPAKRIYPSRQGYPTWSNQAQDHTSESPHPAVEESLSRLAPQNIWCPQVQSANWLPITYKSFKCASAQRERLANVYTCFNRFAYEKIGFLSEDHGVVSRPPAFRATNTDYPAKKTVCILLQIWYSRGITLATFLRLICQTLWQNKVSTGPEKCTVSPLTFSSLGKPSPVQKCLALWRICQLRVIFWPVNNSYWGKAFNLAIL